jgi:hypothetical protein
MNLRAAASLTSAATTQEDAMADNKVEGEGSYTGAKHYNDGVKRTVQSGKVEQAAREAAKLPEDKAAEAAGKRHSHGEDPQLNRK